MRHSATHKTRPFLSPNWQLHSLKPWIPLPHSPPRNIHWLNTTVCICTNTKLEKTEECEECCNEQRTALGTSFLIEGLNSWSCLMCENTLTKTSGCIRMCFLALNHIPLKVRWDYFRHFRCYFYPITSLQTVTKHASNITTDFLVNRQVSSQTMAISPYQTVQTITHHKIPTELPEVKVLPTHYTHCQCFLTDERCSYHWKGTRPLTLTHRHTRARAHTHTHTHTHTPHWHTGSSVTPATHTHTSSNILHLGIRGHLIPSTKPRKRIRVCIQITHHFLPSLK